MESKFSTGIIAVLILLFQGGCAHNYNQLQLSGGKTFEVERIASSPLYISWIHATQNENEMIITGTLRSNMHHTTGAGHVDVAVLDPGDKLLAATSIDYNPKIFHRFRGEEPNFEVRLPFIPPNGSKIRLKLHYSPILEPNESHFENNQAAEKNVDGQVE